LSEAAGGQDQEIGVRGRTHALCVDESLVDFLMDCLHAQRGPLTVDSSGYAYHVIMHRDEARTTQVSCYYGYETLLL
jgi:hypothetical protein